MVAKEYVDEFGLTLKIAETLDKFNFDKVMKVMETLGLKWYLRGGFYVPNRIELVNQASQLLEMACRDSIKSKESCTVGSGGFYATVDASDGYMKIWFEVTSWKSWNED